MLQLMIKVSPSLAESLRDSVGGSADELNRLVEEAGGTIGKPTGSVGETAQYFAIENLSSGKAEQLRRALERLPGVEAAYLKPADELP